MILQIASNFYAKSNFFTIKEKWISIDIKYTRKKIYNYIAHSANDRKWLTV